MKAALEWRWKTRYNVRYIDLPLTQLPRLDLGRFDAAIALNSLYYLEEEEIASLVRHLSSITDLLLIQCNTLDHRRLGRRPTPRFMRQMLAENGFPATSIDAPWDRPRRGIWPQRYIRPVVVGRRLTLELPRWPRAR